MDPTGTEVVETIVEGLLGDLASRDLDRIAVRFDESVTWQNVPHAIVVGRDAVMEMLGDVITRCDRVEWEVVSAAFRGDTAWVERRDHFWIDGKRHTVECNGVVTVDPAANTVVAVRDYVDLGEWRTRLGPALAQRSQEVPSVTVERHLDAVRRLDPVSMAADYANDAVLRRGDVDHAGRSAIAAYFRTVPGRLADRTLQLDEPQARGDGTVTVTWNISGLDGDRVAGTDTFTVAGGRIVRQIVETGGHDF